MLGISGQLASPAALLGSAQKRKRGEAEDSPRLQFRAKTAHRRRLSLAPPLQVARLFAQGHLLLLRESQLTLVPSLCSAESLREVVLGCYEEPGLHLTALLLSRDEIGKAEVLSRSD